MCTDQDPYHHRCSEQGGDRIQRKCAIGQWEPRQNLAEKGQRTTNKCGRRYQPMMIARPEECPGDVWRDKTEESDGATKRRDGAGQ